MGCFCIGINHTSHGLVKVSPKRRLLLELISGILLIISWCIIIPGLIQVGTSYWKNIDEFAESVTTPSEHDGEIIGHNLEEEDKGVAFVLESYCVGFFLFGNGIYLIVTIFYAILNLIYRKDILLRKSVVGRSEWKEREKQEYCFDICNPLNGLRIFHHLEHRAAFLLNLMTVGYTVMIMSSYEATGILSTILFFSSSILIIAFIQTFLSYFYAEDIALCGMSICCVHFWFVRRYPQEDSDVALTVANEENPARAGKYNQFQNEEDVSPPPYSQVV